MEEATICNKCGAQQTSCEAAISEPGGWAKGECILINCPRLDCKARWFYCKSCRKRCSRTNLRTHPNGGKHKELSKKWIEDRKTDNDKEEEKEEENLFEKYTETMVADEESVAALQPTQLIREMEADLQAANTVEVQQLETDLALTFHENADDTMAIDPKPQAGTPNTFPELNKAGNEWLLQTTKSLKRATLAELHHAFADPQLSHMKNFWVAEHACGPGRCGGGLCYLAARASQHASDARLDKDKDILPDFNEAHWHFKYMLQYQSMNQAQRRRQAELNRTVNSTNFGASLFQRTSPPGDHSQLARYYGQGSMYSMYRSLPIPRATNIDGVAYVSPKAILAHAIANGVPQDDFLILAAHKGGKVMNIEDCRQAREWAASAKAAYRSKNGGEPPIIALVIVCWKDGFCYNNCKSNRSLDLMTMNLGAPKHLVNGTENTFPVAVGLKKAKGWIQVEQVFTDQMKELEMATVDKPLMFYNGVLGKMQPVLVKRFAFLADRPERAVVTHTVAYNGDAHRNFGVSGKIETVAYNVEDITILQKEERLGTETSSWNWPDQYVKTCDKDGNKLPRRNGASIPSCKECRGERLRLLGMIGGGNKRARASCTKCVDWETAPSTNRTSLDFEQNKEYPKHYTVGSPVPAPMGRDRFQFSFAEDGSPIGHRSIKRSDLEEAPLMRLPFMKLTFPVMLQACKFAFYQASRAKVGVSSWNKATTLSYLTYCGVSPKVGESLYNAAENCRKQNKQCQVEYNSPTFVGVPSPGMEEAIVFPPIWNDNLELSDFIETTMHQLGLGIGKSILEMITEWLKSDLVPAASKLGSNPLRRSMQELLQDLKKVRSSWNNPLLFNESDKKGYSTGGWVSESWFTMIRFAKPLFGWCARPEALGSQYGTKDLSRMVICLVALVARCLTHSAIDDAFIAETKLVAKEFLSCMRDFDVRSRFDKLGKKDKHNKVAEAFWEKSNVASLLNLIETMLVKGPLKNFWDGGGKGEKYIQEVKPNIKKGIRGDYAEYCVGLMDKLFRINLMDLLEKRYCRAKEGPNKSTDESDNEEEEEQPVENRLDDIEDEMRFRAQADPDGSSVPELVEDPPSVRNFSTLEEQGMAKARTYHIYRKKDAMEQAIKDLKPLAGVVVATLDHETGKTAFEFQMLYRKPVKQFARTRVTFDDDKGLNFNGMWCSEIQVDPGEESFPPATKLGDILRKAKYSAVAIPLKYVIGDKHEHSTKYYVTTNLWMERVSDGSYQLPSLDSSLYAKDSPHLDDSDEMEGLLEAATRPSKKRRRAKEDAESAAI